MIQDCGREVNGAARMCPARYWTVIRRVPLTLAELSVAVMVAVPAPGKVAVLLDDDAKFTTLELLEIQVAELVTSEPLEVAVKAWAVLPTWKMIFATVPTAVVGHGLMVMPVGTVAVAVPVTPLKLAVIVTAPPVPTAVAFPALLPDVIRATAQGFELVHVADLVTSFVVLSEYAARAVKGCVAPAAGEAVLGFTVIVLGWFTKNPLHPGATISRANTTKAAILDNFRSELGIIYPNLHDPLPKQLTNCSREVLAANRPLYQRVHSPA